MEYRIQCRPDGMTKNQLVEFAKRAEAETVTLSV